MPEPPYSAPPDRFLPRRTSLGYQLALLNGDEVILPPLYIYHVRQGASASFYSAFVRSIRASSSWACGRSRQVARSGNASQ